MQGVCCYFEWDWVFVFGFCLFNYDFYGFFLWVDIGEVEVQFQFGDFVFQVEGVVVVDKVKWLCYIGFFILFLYIDYCVYGNVFFLRFIGFMFWVFVEICKLNGVFVVCNLVFFFKGEGLVFYIDFLAKYGIKNIFVQLYFGVNIIDLYWIVIEYLILQDQYWLNSEYVVFIQVLNMDGGFDRQVFFFFSVIRMGRVVVNVDQFCMEVFYKEGVLIVDGYGVLKGDCFFDQCFVYFVVQVVFLVFVVFYIDFYLWQGSNMGENIMVQVMFS